MRNNALQAGDALARGKCAEWDALDKTRKTQKQKQTRGKGKCKVKNHRMNAEKSMFIKMAILNFLRW